MDWSHAHPVRIVAGTGLLPRLVPLLAPARRVLLVTSAGTTRRGVTGRIVDDLQAHGIACLVHDAVEPNPRLDTLDALATQLQPFGPEAILAVGGGSALDAGKVLSVLLHAHRPGALHRAFRLGEGQAWQGRLPVVAVPTTSGTGAEVTPFATVWDPDAQRKHSVAGELLYPVHAVLDAELTLSLPGDETLYTALDALSHALESLWNRHRTPVSAAYSLQALSLSSRALPRVLSQPHDVEARAMLQQASLLAGLAISQTRTAIAHSVSYPLTLRYDVPHGLACSFTLPALLEAHMDALADAVGQREVLVATLALLRQVDFGSHLARHATPEQIVALRGGMVTPGRADNFLFAADLDVLLDRSLSARSR